MAVAVDRAYRLRSWDHNCIPKPFAKIVFQFGEPILFPPLEAGEGLERYTEKIEAALALVEKKAKESL